MTRTTEELNLKLYLMNLKLSKYMWLVAVILDSTDFRPLGRKESKVSSWLREGKRLGSTSGMLNNKWLYLR